MDTQYNINKLHTKLKSTFREVEINEKFSQKMGNYFEILVKESKTVKMIIPYKNLDNKVFIDWMYYSNPLNESSDLIERSGLLENLPTQIQDVLSNNRFSEEYVKNNI